MGMITCQKCGKAMDEKNFYMYRDGRKTELCKKCLTMHVDAFEPETFTWILEKLDVPYIPAEWDVLRNKDYAKDPYKFSSTAVFGKYLSKMKLNQFRDYTWADTKRLQEEYEANNKDEKVDRTAMEQQLKQDFQSGKIGEAEYKTLVSEKTQHAETPRMAPPSAVPAYSKNPYQDASFIPEDDIPDPAAELSDEDRLYLAMKWGRLYKPNEWIELERKYAEMEQGFDIQDPDTKGTLILICKTYLKLNQAIDVGDVDGYNKLARTYDTLRKSTKFTAAQNKKETSDFVECVGEMVAYCEKEGGQIPRFEIDAPRDIIDTEINDLKSYTKSLIYQDTALAQQIENYLKQREAIEQKRKDNKFAKEKGLEVPELSDEDYSMFLDQMHLEKEKDEKVYTEV